MSELISNKTLLAHAQWYRAEEKELNTRPIEWVTGHKEERIAEKLDIAEYFEKLAAS